jgi:hypothetical protein
VYNLGAPFAILRYSGRIDLRQTSSGEELAMRAITVCDRRSVIRRLLDIKFCKKRRNIPRQDFGSYGIDLRANDSLSTAAI